MMDAAVVIRHRNSRSAAAAGPVTIFIVAATNPGRGATKSGGFSVWLSWPVALDRRAWAAQLHDVVTATADASDRGRRCQ